MRLYKYLSAERRDVVANCCMRFTQAADFNDPFELLPSFDVPESAEAGDAFLSLLEDDVVEYFARIPASEIGHADHIGGLTGVVAGHLTARKGLDPRELVPATLPILPKRSRLLFGSTIQVDFGERLGILSLSETPDNLLMWAHYADCHRGFVIELDTSHDFFQQGGVHLGSLRPVAYSDSRPEFPLEIDPSPGWVTQYLSRVLLTKSLDWAYEREWRMLVQLSDKSRFPHDEVGRIHLFHLPPECMTAIIFGNRSSEALRESILAAVAANPRLGHVEIRYAHIDPARFALRIDTSVWPTFVPDTVWQDESARALGLTTLPRPRSPMDAAPGDTERTSPTPLRAEPGEQVPS